MELNPTKQNEKSQLYRVLLVISAMTIMKSTYSEKKGLLPLSIKQSNILSNFPN